MMSLKRFLQTAEEFVILHLKLFNPLGTFSKHDLIIAAIKAELMRGFSTLPG